MKYATLTESQIAAIHNFARCYGRKWKEQLAFTYWYNARIWTDDNGDSRDGHILHTLRNSHGPKWLAKYKVDHA